jgi:hypothetical protein
MASEDIDSAKANSLEFVCRLALARRPLWLLLAISAALGVLNAASLLPWGLVTGESHFWDFPHGIFPASDFDMATVLVGYRYFVHAAWQIPLLQAPLLDGGTNIFWLDAGPWLALLGKAIFTLTGRFVIIYGPYLFLCFALPGVMMTLLLTQLGQKNLLAVLAGTILANATPYLLFRWGHIALCSHFLIIAALALYVWSRRGPFDWRTAGAWTVFLAFAALTNIYLFTMVAGIWLALMAQQQINRFQSMPRLAAYAAITGLTVIGVLAPMVPLGTGAAMAATQNFGQFPMDLLSPFLPQTSGLMPPPLNTVWLSPEGFAYLGAGVLLLLVLSLGWLWPTMRGVASRHTELFVVFALFLLFALSNVIVIAKIPVIAIPLPDIVGRGLGIFRSSGRFVWPLGYCLLTILILNTIRTRPPLLAGAILIAAALLQWADTAPLRAAIARSTAAPLPPVLDQAQIARLTRSARGIIVIPNFGCSGADPSLSDAEQLFDKYANMELQLEAARADIPINSSYRARGNTGCAETKAAAAAPIRAGVLYVYLPKRGNPPAGVASLSCEKSDAPGVEPAPPALFCMARTD